MERTRVYLRVVCAGRGRDGRVVRRTLERTLASGVQTPQSVVSALLSAEGLAGPAWVLAAIRPSQPVRPADGPVLVVDGADELDETGVLEANGWDVARALAVLGPNASRSRLYRLRKAHMPQPTEGEAL